MTTTVIIHKTYKLSGAYSGHMREISWRNSGGTFCWANACTPKQARGHIQRLIDQGYTVTVRFA